MDSTDIQKILDNPNEVFHSTDSDGKTLVMLAYSADHESELLSVAIELKSILQSGDNYIEISKMQDGKKCDLMISSPKLSNPVFLGAIRCNESTYDELLLQKEHEEKVSLSFYIYNKQVIKTDAAIKQAKQASDYDQDRVIAFDEPTYVSLTIPVAGDFAIKSDDDFSNPAIFHDQDPSVAMALAAQLRKQKDQEDAASK